jgi:polyhydroxyalkanoate synthase
MTSTEAPTHAYVDDPPTTTPFEVVFEAGLLRLRHYRPERAPSRAPPVLLVYSLFKRPFVLDLLPDRSVVRTLLRQGFSVYLTDWLAPGPKDAGRGLRDYMESDLAGAVECVRRRERVDRIALVGVCLGGFLATVYSALHPQHVDRLVTFALPFQSRPPFAPAAAEYFAAVFGNIPAWWIRAGLNAHVADPQHLPAYLAAELSEPELAQRPQSPGAAAVRHSLETWFASDVPFAGRLFLDVMAEAYGRGRFAADLLMVGDRRVALGAIGCPVLNVCAERDHLVPPEESAAFVRHVGSRDATTLTFACGHLGLMVSRGAHKDLWPRVCKWLGGDATPIAGTLGTSTSGTALDATGTG